MAARLVDISKFEPTLIEGALWAAHQVVGAASAGVSVGVSWVPGLGPRFRHVVFSDRLVLVARFRVSLRTSCASSNFVSEFFG